jgi:hypothetical protein
MIGAVTGLFRKASYPDFSAQGNLGLSVGACLSRFEQGFQWDMDGVD